MRPIAEVFKQGRPDKKDFWENELRSLDIADSKVCSFMESPSQLKPEDEGGRS